MCNYDNEIVRIVNETKEKFEMMSDYIWEEPELRFNEYKAAQVQKNFFQKNDFRIIENLAGIDTAFVAEYGTGFPVIAFLGEFDALPEMSQRNDLLDREFVIEGGAGHGCGHHLLGVAAIEAVHTLKKIMQRDQIKGTIRYYGCPAEEGGSGKAFMVREGAFEDVNAAFSWHPGDKSILINKSLANVRVIFNFTGVSSHAAAAPHLGRSALDAVELMNVGTNYLREHIIPEARVHYALTKSGGDAPNIVQAEAESIYAIRAPRITQVNEILDRISKIAKGAALMTETDVEISIVSSYANLIENETLDRILMSKMKAFLPIDYSEAEIEYARGFNALTSNVRYEKPMATEVFNLPPNFIPPMSTDVGDVSWIVPTTVFGAPTFALGTQVHTWLATAQGKSAIAHKGMHYAAMVMAGGALDILKNPQLVPQMEKDLLKAKKGEQYVSIIPQNIEPGSF